MAIHCVTREDAVKAARLMRLVGEDRPAVVGITYPDVLQPEWWAVANVPDMESLPGHVESLEIISAWVMDNTSQPIIGPRVNCTCGCIMEYRWVNDEWCAVRICLEHTDGGKCLCQHYGKSAVTWSCGKCMICGRLADMTSTRS